MNACKLCLGAGVDEAKVTFETDEEFYGHIAAEHDVSRAETLPEPETVAEEPEPRRRGRR